MNEWMTFFHVSVFWHGMLINRKTGSSTFSGGDLFKEHEADWKMKPLPEQIIQTQDSSGCFQSWLGTRYPDKRSLERRNKIDSYIMQLIHRQTVQNRRHQQLHAVTLQGPGALSERERRVQRSQGRSAEIQKRLFKCETTWKENNQIPSVKRRQTYSDVLRWASRTVGLKRFRPRVTTDRWWSVFSKGLLISS